MESLQLRPIRAKLLPQRIRESTNQAGRVDRLEGHRESLAVFQAFIPLLVKSQLSYSTPLEKKKAIHSSNFVWKHPMDKGAWQTTIVHGVTKSRI